MNGDVIRRGATLDSGLDLLVGDPQQPQFFPGRLLGLPGGLSDPLQVAFLKVLDRFHGLNEFGLGREQFRAVNRGHGLALFDNASGIIHIQLIDPSTHPCGNVP